MTIALAGVDCKDLFKVLITFFGTQSGEDPFQYLDAAPVIKSPLELMDTESEDEGSTKSGPSTISLLLLASTSSVVPVKKPIRIKRTNIYHAELIADINETQEFLSQSVDTLHTTGILPKVDMARSDKQTSHGALFYMCKHPDCGSTPYMGDLHS